LHVTHYTKACLRSRDPTFLFVRFTQPHLSRNRPRGANTLLIPAMHRIENINMSMWHQHKQNCATPALLCLAARMT